MARDVLLAWRTVNREFEVQHVTTDATRNFGALSKFLMSEGCEEDNLENKEIAGSVAIHVQNCRNSALLWNAGRVSSFTP